MKPMDSLKSIITKISCGNYPVAHQAELDRIEHDKVHAHRHTESDASLAPSIADDMNRRCCRSMAVPLTGEVSTGAPVSLG